MQTLEWMAVRLAQEGDLDTMDKLMVEEGWPTDLQVRRALIARHPAWWSVATSSQGVVLGQLGCVRPDPTTACLTEYIVELQNRGRGVGTLMWKSVCDDIPGSVSQWLSAFPGSRPMEIYRDVYDFQHCCFFTLYDGQLDKTRLTSALDQAQPAGPGGDGDLRVIPIQGPTPELVLYDTQVRGKERSLEFFKDYILSDNVSASAVVQNASGDVIGYGMHHRFDKGGLILGPVYADNDDAARKLLAYLLGGLSEGERLMINSITNNLLMSTLIQKLGLKEIFTLSFMKKGGGDGGIQLHKVYATSSANCYDYV